MANTGVSHGEVKSICESLEVSPSKSQPTSHLYNGGGTEPEAKSHSPKHKSGAGGHLTNSESGFGKKGSSMPRNIAAGKKADSNKKI
jgi:hypothetical protein